MPVRTLLIVLSVIFFVACKSKDKERGADSTIYLDYKIIAEDGNDNLVATAQFRNEDGDALQLISPAGISLDGAPMDADSSKYSGYTYETYRAIDSFNGSHVFTYINEKDEKSEVSFQFTRPGLSTSIPDTVSRGDFELQFTGLPEKAKVRLVMIDTSYANEELNQVETVENGRLLIPATAFETVSAGPVQLEMVLESSKPAGEGRPGRVLMMYSFRKEFLLKD